MKSPKSRILVQGSRWRKAHRKAPDSSAPTGHNTIAQGSALVFIHIFGERLAGLRDAPGSRSVGILPALANEERKAGTLAAILSRPIGWRARRPPPLTRRLRGISERQPSQAKDVYKAQGSALGHGSPHRFKP